MELAVRPGHTEVMHRQTCGIRDAHRSNDRLVVMASSWCRVRHRASPRWTTQYVTVHRIVGEWEELPRMQLLHALHIDQTASKAHDDAAHADRIFERWRAGSMSPLERFAIDTAKARAAIALEERATDSRHRVDLTPIAEVVATRGTELTTWSAFAVTLLEPYEHQVQCIAIESIRSTGEHRVLAEHVGQYAQHDTRPDDVELARQVAFETITKQR